MVYNPSLQDSFHHVQNYVLPFPLSSVVRPTMSRPSIPRRLVSRGEDESVS
jgi:hypothetical protein